MKLLLLPFAWIYGTVIRLRNLLFNAGIFASTEFDVPVLVVGNLRVGGTGKTPMIMALIDMLPGRRVDVLSRGFGRGTKGYFEVSVDAFAHEVGDEPLLIKQYSPTSIVVVDENRVRGLRQMLRTHPEIELVLLDDAMQHRWVRPGHLMLLTAYHKRYTKDFLLPAGRLREPRSEAIRADTVVVTKCPSHLSSSERRQIMQELSLRPHQAVFFAYEDYGNLIRLKDRSKLTWEALKPTGVLLISGLADATTMRSYISARVNDVQHLDYNDHHAYRESDLEHLMAQFERFHTDSKIIVTTEKDAQRLAKWLQNEKFADLPIYALQHRMRWFASEEESVENRLHGFIKAHTRNH